MTTLASIRKTDGIVDRADTVLSKPTLCLNTYNKNTQRVATAKEAVSVNFVVVYRFYNAHVVGVAVVANVARATPKSRALLYREYRNGIFFPSSFGYFITYLSKQLSSTSSWIDPLFW